MSLLECVFRRIASYICGRADTYAIAKQEPLVLGCFGELIIARAELRCKRFVNIHKMVIEMLVIQLFGRRGCICPQRVLLLGSSYPFTPASSKIYLGMRLLFFQYLSIR
jgi:hypothetical protein